MSAAASDDSELWYERLSLDGVLGTPEASSQRGPHGVGLPRATLKRSEGAVPASPVLQTVELRHREDGRFVRRAGPVWALRNLSVVRVHFLKRTGSTTTSAPGRNSSS